MLRRNTFHVLIFASIFLSSDNIDLFRYIEFLYSLSSDFMWLVQELCNFYPSLLPFCVVGCFYHENTLAVARSVHRVVLLCEFPSLPSVRNMEIRSLYAFTWCFVSLFSYIRVSIPIFSRYVSSQCMYVSIRNEYMRMDIAKVFMALDRFSAFSLVIITFIRKLFARTILIKLHEVNGSFLLKVNRRPLFLTLFSFYIL